LELENIEAEKQRVAEEREGTKAARSAEIDRLIALQKNCFEERARRLLVEQQVTYGHSQSTNVFSPSLPHLQHTSLLSVVQVTSCSTSSDQHKSAVHYFHRYSTRSSLGSGEFNASH